MVGWERRARATGSIWKTFWTILCAENTKAALLSDKTYHQQIMGSEGKGSEHAVRRRFWHGSDHLSKLWHRLHPGTYREQGHLCTEHWELRESGHWDDLRSVDPCTRANAKRGKVLSSCSRHQALHGLGHNRCHVLLGPRWPRPAGSWPSL